MRVTRQTVPRFDLLGCDVREGNGKKDAAGEGVGDAEDLGVLAAVRRPGWKHTRDSRLESDENNENNLSPED